MANEKIALRKNVKGVKGSHPLGCLPHWGSEGVTLVFSTEWKTFHTRRFRISQRMKKTAEG